MADAAPNSQAQDSTVRGRGGAYNPAAGYLNAEARRTLASPTFGTAPFSVPVPRDTVLKRMGLKLILQTQVTYGSGSPATSHQGVFDRICPRVELNVNGSRIVKSVRPHLVRMHNMIQNAEHPRRAYYFDSSAPTVTRAQREWVAGVVAYPATTQYMLFNEMIELSFENPWGYAGSRSVSELDIRDVASCDMWFYWGAISNLQEDGVGASVTYSTSPTVTVIPQIIENRARPRPQAGDVLFDYVETSFAQTFTGQANNQQMQLQTGNYLMGLGLYVNNGDTNLTPADNLLQQISLLINGASAIQGPIGNMADLQDENQVRFGVSDDMGLADYASSIASTANVHPLQGFAMMNLIRNGDWNTAINTSRQAGVDTVKLQFNTPSSSGTDAATYTNPLQVTVHTHEMRPFAYTR